jgi:hypothetical protein
MEEKRKRGRPRKSEVLPVAEAPRKRGRPKKVKPELTKDEQMHEIAKLGKRKYKKAVEQMAIDKVNKKIRKKRNGFGNGGDDGFTKIIAVRQPNFGDGGIVAGPNVLPIGQIEMRKREAAAAAHPKEERKKKDPKLSKVELNRFLKRLIAHGRKPHNVKVIENKEKYFTIEFNDGKDGPLTTCSHAKGWDE